MINEIPKSDFHSPTTRASAPGSGAPTQPKQAPRPLRDVSRDAMRDTLPDLGPELPGMEDGLAERDTDVDPVRIARGKAPSNKPAKGASDRPPKSVPAEILAPEILLSEGYGPTPDISAQESPERPRIEVVEGGIPDESTASGPRSSARRTLGERARDARTELEQTIRENPIRAVGIAAGAGFAAGAALFATPVVRVLVGGIASVALQSDGAKRIYGHVGNGIVDKLEGFFIGGAKG